VAFLDPAAVEYCTIFPSLITNLLLQLVRDIINVNGVCYQRYDKRLEQQKGRPNVNICAAEENLEQKLYLLSVFDYHFNSSKHTRSFFM